MDVDVEGGDAATGKDDEEFSLSAFEALEKDKDGTGAAAEFMQKHYSSALPLLGGAQAAALKKLAASNVAFGWAARARAIILLDRSSPL